MQNVTEQKKALRKQAMLQRKSLSQTEKKKKDKIIFEKIISLNEYKTAKIILCYYSTEYEIDTVMLINHALQNGKKVALPLCLDKIGNMEFRYIMSTNELAEGQFNIPEPQNSNETFENSENALCIVPSLMTDKNNFRLGYGKGYYDRFLKDFKGKRIVLCYKENVTDNLPFYSSFDVKCDMCITD